MALDKYLKKEVGKAVWENFPPVSSTPPKKLAPVTTPAGKLLTRLKKRIPHSSPPSSSPLSSNNSSSSSSFPLPLTSTTAFPPLPTTTTTTTSPSTTSPPLSTTTTTTHITTLATSTHTLPPSRTTTTTYASSTSSSYQPQKDKPRTIAQKEVKYERRPDYNSTRAPPVPVYHPAGTVIPLPVDPMALYTPKDAIWKAKPKKGAWTQYRTPAAFPQPERSTSAPTFSSTASSSAFKPKPFTRYSSPSYASEPSFQHSQQDLEELLKGITEAEEEDVELKQGTPEGLLVTLKKYQLHGVAWMVQHEKGKTAGGILADDMGLGKTIQSLALMLSNPPEDPKRKTTLIIAPLALLRQWEAEINTRCKKGTFSVYVYHGPRRTKDPKVLAKYDVVITTYTVTVAEFPRGVEETLAEDDDKLDAASPGENTLLRPRGTGPLFGVAWYRIILDEGQTIKNRATRSAISCFNLRAQKRWVLSGTPIQNNIDELYSLLRFLNIQPYSKYAAFHEYFTLPLQAGRDRTVMKRLQVVLKSVMLRRTKTTLINGKPILDLPPRIVHTDNLEFSVDERAFYSQLENKVHSSFESIVKANGNNKVMFLILLLRLRQACNHPRLVAASQAEDSEALEPKATKEEDQNADELALLMKGMTVGSKERNCSVCLQSLRTDTDSSITECPMCRLAIQDRKKLEEERDGPFESSTKIDEMMRILADTKKKDPTSKTIIFSQFTTMLDIAQVPIRKAGYVFCRYDGKMSNPLREESLRQLKENPECTIILVSLKCGSLGLNLTAAHRVIMLDIWFNPMVEEQAIDRAHRLGQTRPVQVHRLVIRGSVEERILVLQDKKRELAKGALGEGLAKLGQLSMDDYKFLFSKAAELAEH